MIKQPYEMDYSNSKFTMIIYGSPGIGKTSLALSAPKPLLIDFDKGIQRAIGGGKYATLVCSTYEDVLADVRNREEMDKYETIIIDTGGSFITYLKDWAMRVKGARQKDGEFNSLKGFGYVKSEFANFTDYLKVTLNKNVIYIFHSQEQADRDGNPVQRLLCEGSARSTVWNGCDFGGYMHAVGSSRVISFQQTDEYYAKKSMGIKDQYQIPTVEPGDKYTFVTNLFDQAKKYLKDKNAKEKEMHDEYLGIMAQVHEIIDNIGTIEAANEAAITIPTLGHVSTSEDEARALLFAKTKELGYAWDKTEKTYKAG